MIQKHRKNGNLYLGLAFVMMGILFYSSSQTYEQQSQIGLLSTLLKKEPFKEVFMHVSFTYAGSEVSIAQSGYFSFVEFFIRKGAHFGTYFILGGSFFLGLVPRIQTFGLTALFSWLSATGYAATDEFHQMLTGGRTPLFQDVMLDASGAFTGIVLCWLVLGFREKRII
ncbi:VanZ family protein [Enterococcus sp. LJL98]